MCAHICVCVCGEEPRKKQYSECKQTQQQYNVHATIYIAYFEQSAVHYVRRQRYCLLVKSSHFGRERRKWCSVWTMCSFATNGHTSRLSSFVDHRSDRCAWDTRWMEIQLTADSLCLFFFFAHASSSFTSLLSIYLSQTHACTRSPPSQTHKPKASIAVNSFFAIQRLCDWTLLYNESVCVCVNWFDVFRLVWLCRSLFKLTLFTAYSIMMEEKGCNIRLLSHKTLSTQQAEAIFHVHSIVVCALFEFDVILYLESYVAENHIYVYLKLTFQFVGRRIDKFIKR